MDVHKFSFELTFCNMIFQKFSTPKYGTILFLYNFNVFSLCLNVIDSMNKVRRIVQKYVIMILHCIDLGLILACVCVRADGEILTFSV